MVNIIPSFLVHSQEEFEEKLHRIESFVSHIHVDIMDGIFVSNTTWADITTIERMLPRQMTYEAHCMVVDPLRFCSRWAGAQKMRQVIFHIEAMHHVRELITCADAAKKELWLALNPETPVEKIERTARLVDGILVMGVHPGFSAQTIDARIYEKIRVLRKQLPKLPVTIDGGVNEKTAPYLRDAGATGLVSASYLFSHANIQSAIDTLKH